jgi:hypothetical protein
LVRSLLRHQRLDHTGGSLSNGRGVRGMSKMAELSYDIQELYIDGLSAKQIASELGCPVEMVLRELAEMNVEDVAEIEEIYSPYYGA